jgi:hypothetical protein
MLKIILIFVLAVALTSCAIDYSQASTLQLCDNVLNHTGAGMYSQSPHNARLNELSRRGEDCSSFMHLRRPVSPVQSVNVDVN